MQVPLLDLKPQYRALKAEIDAAIERVCDAQAFILGPAVKELEGAVAAYSGCRFGIGMSSGTDALLAALMALDIGPQDAVITTPYTFFATAGTIARVGALPLFVDIDPYTFNLTGAAVERFLRNDCERRDGKVLHRRSGRTIKAIMPVHLYGQMVDMDPLMAVAREFELRVIEDSAQAIGSGDAQGRRACSIGDIGCLSFFPTKNLGAFGDAGMCVTNDPDLAARLAMIRVHGMEPKYYHQLVGGNFRIDELQAAVLVIKLRHLDDWSRARQENACFYFGAFERAGLKKIVTLPAALPGRHIYNQFIIRAPNRDALKAHLGQSGVGTEIYYPVPLHRQQCFANLGHGAGDFPESERAAAETLALPIFPELSREQLQYVVDCIARFYGKA
ncbi:MAG: DegT/DnrJ/EryC1/StrS family aminotransferase [Gammaproteobacteria bacterium]|nr:DegT/DnrJ/EryC1/StrS family aminotransferase [Gammaproteobacteria bacterium]MBM4229847.1 DegT/DnrJ/EryC1/StrS family aminotransferase [Gammaproteobacteria bacterium]